MADTHPMPVATYIYQAAPTRVIDGDTVVITVDVGFRVQTTQRMRLLGVNCPEVRGPEAEAGQAARAFTIDWLPAATVDQPYPLIVQTRKPVDDDLNTFDSFGRWLAILWRKSDGACLGDDLIAAGHAVPYRVEGVP